MSLWSSADVDKSLEEEIKQNRIDELNFAVQGTESFIFGKTGCWIKSMGNSQLVNVFSEEMMAYFLDNRQTDDEFNRKMAFRDDLRNIVQKYSDEGGFHWNFGVHATGSTVSCLAARNSDVDICVWFPDAVEVYGDSDNEKKFASKELLQIIRHMLVRESSLREDVNVKTMDLVMAAIPVLKITTKDDLEVDVSVCVDRFVSGVHNSFLIRGYAAFDDRFAPLCMLVKDWAAHTGMKNPTPKIARFNSYALVMLVIHYLQSGVAPPVLPNLQKSFPGFYASSETCFPELVDFSHPLPDLQEFNFNKNTMSLGQLFIGFVSYYAEFKFEKHRVCLKDSTAKPRDNTKFTVEIVDPIDHHNPGRTVKDIEGCLSIFRAASSLFKNALDHPDHYSFPAIPDLFRR